MIGCPCGGFTVSASERERGLILKYQRCGACGRCARWRFERDGSLVSEGETARREYRAARTNRETPNESE